MKVLYAAFHLVFEVVLTCSKNYIMPDGQVNLLRNRLMFIPGIYLKPFKIVQDIDTSKAIH